MKEIVNLTCQLTSIEEKISVVSKNWHQNSLLFNAVWFPNTIKETESYKILGKGGHTLDEAFKVETEKQLKKVEYKILKESFDKKNFSTDYKENFISEQGWYRSSRDSDHWAHNTKNYEPQIGCVVTPLDYAMPLDEVFEWEILEYLEELEKNGIY